MGIRDATHCSGGANTVPIAQQADGAELIANGLSGTVAYRAINDRRPEKREAGSRTRLEGVRTCVQLRSGPSGASVTRHNSRG